MVAGPEYGPCAPGPRGGFAKGSNPSSSPCVPLGSVAFRGAMNGRVKFDIEREKAGGGLGKAYETIYVLTKANIFV